MAGRDSFFLLCLVGLWWCSLYQGAQGEYLITVPKHITAGSPTQFCVFNTDPGAPTGSIDVSIGRNRYGVTQKPVLNTTIVVPEGKHQYCEDLIVNNVDYNSMEMNITGSLNNKQLNHTIQLDMHKKAADRVFIQSDKHFYQAGETVQFRILTISGRSLNVSTDNYPEVWVEAPSKTRIAQWLDVQNADGIVHLSMDLVDEPEEGYYNIRLKTKEGYSKSQNFRVGEYVLPRFDVEIQRPSFTLSTDESFNLTVCAKYTFGQPVKGHLVVNITNNKHGFCRDEFTRKANVTGCQSFEFTTAEMKVTDCMNIYDNVYSMPVSVSFEEEETGIQMTESSSISINRFPISFEKIYADKYIKPNLPITVKIKAKYPDSTAASGIPVEVCAAVRCNNMTTASDGIFTAVLPIYRTKRIFMKTLNYRADDMYINIERMYSPSNSSLLIFAPEEELKCSSSGPREYILPVMFSATNQTSAFITVQVMSRGQMQFTSTKEYQFTPSELPISSEHLIEPIPSTPKGYVRGVLNMTISLPTSASPTARVLIWYKKNDGEVVSDMRELNVQSRKCLRNSVNLSWAIEQGQPGDETTLSLASKPNSVCSLGVVDRSTLLLSKASDQISLSRLFDFAEPFEFSSFYRRQVNDWRYCKDKVQKETEAEEPDYLWKFYGYRSDFVDALHMFDNAGLLVFSDLAIETRPCVTRYDFTISDSAVVEDSTEPAEAFEQDQDSAEPAVVEDSIEPADESFEQDQEHTVGVSSSETISTRMDFPETWLWDIVVVPASGVHNQTVTLPDTITEWVGNAVCALPTEGVGLSEETSITTFLPFFIDLTLPPSIKRGEILPVKISVFNYLGQKLPVTIRLEESPEYEILEEQSSSKSGPKGQRTTCLAAQDKDVLTVRIDSKELGDVNLTVTAKVDYGSSPDCVVDNQSVHRTDTIIKSIKVEPEGYPREKTWTKYICSEDFETGENSLEVWDVSLPQKIVQGSERGWVSGVGNLLALSLENLGHLIRMPYGCGEQNMLNFAPNIFLMKYQDTTKQNNPQISEKLMRFMTTGYRRELLYRHEDGSFSAFGSADDSGSTWLTAFVLKSFAQAQPYILIDKESLNQTRKWLLENQDEDGCFRSIGKVIHKGMKGGITGGNDSIPLTTYVTISLLEAGENPLSSDISSAIKCINSSKTTDPYTLALKAYAFALANHSQVQKTIQQLLGLATDEKNAMYWDLPKSPSKSRSVELETAAYALLAILEIDNETYKTQTRNIVKWITAKQNGRGGFYSTQDTVMALQALARFETRFQRAAMNTTATVKAANLTHAFTITESNKLLQQQVSLTKLPTNVTLTTEGQGCAVLQAVLRYNIPDPEPSDAFNLTVNTGTEPDRLCKTKLITACASYRLEDGQSNMAVIEVNLVSGYIPEKEDLKQLVRNNRDVIKRYEVDGNKVSFYIEELTPKSTCVNFKITREVDVENVKPGTVVVYDYYQPEFFISENYTLQPPEECRR